MICAYRISLDKPRSTTINDLLPKLLIYSSSDVKLGHHRQFVPLCSFQASECVQGLHSYKTYITRERGTSVLHLSRKHIYMI